MSGLITFDSRRSVRLSLANLRLPAAAALGRPLRANCIHQLSLGDGHDPAVKGLLVLRLERGDLAKDGNVRLLAYVFGGQAPSQVGRHLVLDRRDEPVVMQQQQLLDRGPITCYRPRTQSTPYILLAPNVSDDGERGLLRCARPPSAGRSPL